MKVTVVENKKGLYVADIEGVSHEFCLLLKDQLLKDSAVTVATYRIDHPLERKARIYIETKGKEASKAIEDAIKKIEKDNKKILSLIEKI